MDTLACSLPCKRTFTAGSRHVGTAMPVPQQAVPSQKPPRVAGLSTALAHTATACRSVCGSTFTGPSCGGGGSAVTTGGASGVTPSCSNLPVRLVTFGGFAPFAACTQRSAQFLQLCAHPLGAKRLQRTSICRTLAQLHLPGTITWHSHTSASCSTTDASKRTS
jgi:hypothetical protein